MRLQYQDAVGRPAPTPYERGFTLEYGLQDGRIRKCDSVAQPNCISTSSTSDLFSPPWLASEANPQQAAQAFDEALRELSPTAELVASEATAGGVYLRYRIPSPFDYDVLEVLVERQRPPYEQDPPLVTFRSQAGTVRYVWPISQPIGDFGAQRNRVVALRKRLGWRINGGDCSLQECYQE